MRRWRAGFAAQFLSLVLAACTSATPTPPPQATPPAASASPQTSTASLAPTFSPTSLPTPSSVPPSPGPTDSVPSPGPTSQPSRQAGLLLSEVRFDPAGGDPAFIEIVNSTAGAIDVHGASLSIDGALLSLRSIAMPLPAGGLVLVVLDGQDSTDGLTLHASSGFVLGTDAGVVELFDNTGLLLDRVAWGGGTAQAVRLTNGGLIPDAIEPGLSIGRAPGMTMPREPLDWVVFGPAEVTPGAVNGLPAPAVLMPFIGGILDSDAHTLSWYPVSGAARYRVLIQAVGATSPELALDVATESVDLDISAYQPGAYGWRVTAVAADGRESLASEASQFEILAPPLAAARAGLALRADSPGKQLSVPLLSQHKDTAMLLLERNVESGPHAWDVAHPDLDVHDPADNGNCGLASAEMVNHFLGGDLSQDRLGYELFKDNEPGPEGDLNYGVGLSSEELTRVLTFALGAAPTRMEPGMTPDTVWATTTASIDGGLPVLAATPGHVFVFTGYSVVDGKRILASNDPWLGSQKLDVDARAGALAPTLELWLPAAGSVGRMQEAGVTQDSDGDGVVDFDEVERFHTDPDQADSDGDKVGDKQDIASSIFDPQYGYAASQSSIGRDFDFDGLATENDPDSDGGGCKDGEEDTNFNGHRDGSETWNFNTDDDHCLPKGAHGKVTYTATAVYDPGGSSERTSSETFTLNVRLKEGGQGLGGFEDDGSSFQYRTTTTGIIGSDLCTAVEQSAYSGAGSISDADGVIHGGLTPLEDQFFLAASIPFEIDGTADYCVFIEPESSQSAAMLPSSQDCSATVVDLDARPRVYNFDCGASSGGLTWTMTGSITVVP